MSGASIFRQSSETDLPLEDNPHTLEASTLHLSGRFVAFGSSMYWPILDHDFIPFRDAQTDEVKRHRIFGQVMIRELTLLRQDELPKDPFRLSVGRPRKGE